MNTVPDDKSDPAAPATASKAEDTLAQARARRLAALKAAEGLWKDRTDISKDGVMTQEQLGMIGADLLDTLKLGR